jgi:hypothetical protein
VTNDAVFVDSVANLAATGSLVNWYSTEDSPVPFFTGNSYTTPPLTETTTYWVSNTTVFGIPNQHVGMMDHQGGSTSDNTYNGGLIFNCLTPFKLKSTKVYTSKSGDRKIKLISQSGLVLQEKTVNIPVGTTVIDLGFNVPVGNGHLLTTDADVNQAVLGTDGPQLRRSNVGVVFPYEVPDIVSIYTSTLDQTRYYYFFDWEIDLGSHTCESPRVPVTADVSVSATNSPVWATDLQIFPNPTTGRLHVSGKNFQGGSLLATVKNAQGISLQSSTFEAASGTFDYQTDLSSLPKGVYWLELAGKDGVVRRMVVVQ